MSLPVPLTSRVHGRVTRHSPQAKHERQCLLLQDLQCDLLNRELSPVPLVSSRLRSTSTCTEVERLTERRADEASFFSVPLLSRGRGGSQRERERKHVRNRNCITVNLTPFTPFKSPFSSESRVKITLWLRLWSCNTPRGGGGRKQRVIMWLLS